MVYPRPTSVGTGIPTWRNSKCQCCADCWCTVFFLPEGSKSPWVSILEWSNPAMPLIFREISESGFETKKQRNRGIWLENGWNTIKQLRDEAEDEMLGSASWNSHKTETTITGVRPIQPPPFSFFSFQAPSRKSTCPGSVMAWVLPGVLLTLTLGTLVKWNCSYSPEGHSLDDSPQIFLRISPIFYDCFHVPQLFTFDPSA